MGRLACWAGGNVFGMVCKDLSVVDKLGWIYAIFILTADATDSLSLICITVPRLEQATNRPLQGIEQPINWPTNPQSHAGGSQVWCQESETIILQYFTPSASVTEPSNRALPPPPSPHGLAFFALWHLFMVGCPSSNPPHPLNVIIPAVWLPPTLATPRGYLGWCF